MAEDKQEKATAPPDHNPGNRDSILDIVKTFLPAIGVFAALIYFFGRLYVEEYYYALGISPDVLTFTMEDYMFSSFNVVVMCLVFSILFYLCWGGILFEQIKGEEAKAKAKEEAIAKAKAEAKEEAKAIAKAKAKVKAAVVLIVIRNPITLIFILLAWLLGLIYYVYFHVFPDSYVTGLSGLATGLMYGLLPVGLVIGIRAAARYMNEGVFRLQWVLAVIVTFSIMPWITADLASAQARSDEYGFHDVRVISRENLHCQMQSATSNLTDCFDGKLIITNNGMTYVMKTIRTSQNTDCRTISLSAAGPKKYLTVSEIRGMTDDFTLCRLVYAIPVESIQDIIYYTQK